MFTIPVIELYKRSIDNGVTPAGAEGVISYKKQYLWYKFSTAEYYNDTLETWLKDTTPEENRVVVDLRPKEKDLASMYLHTDFAELEKRVGASLAANIRASSFNKKSKRKGAENSGLSCNYYVAEVKQPTTTGVPYTAECNDIIETLGMNSTEANIFKELWRTSAARTLGKKKKGSNTKRASEKIAFFGLRYALQNGVSLEELITTLQQMRVQATITKVDGKKYTEFGKNV
ncbi:hypothetical protein vBAspPH44_16 [Alteromonas phage vB_AspP-H4/4]|uniref:Uncharacterized protein n=1 Tax=Alteromonas phage vB_AspP-H4/4 TaxID=2928692 RepID=A0A220YL55_9CAUD|nr:hypothetical protein HOR85_gp16 [Alteromonas phage vB_AspP-H4/4]ASL24399.1 hypothetical protein vBAspPH44_16 [Alteromonas phage vB_AspP-H4/4]